MTEENNERNTLNKLFVLEEALIDKPKNCLLIALKAGIQADGADYDIVLANKNSNYSKDHNLYDIPLFSSDSVDDAHEEMIKRFFEKGQRRHAVSFADKDHFSLFDVIADNPLKIHPSEYFLTNWKKIEERVSEESLSQLYNYYQILTKNSLRS